ncbi:unnamed protein product [Discosporangium mesarthrocarpum]
MAPSSNLPIVRLSDATLSGVDFHCCPIVDEVLRSPSTLRKVEAAMGITPFPARQGRTEWGDAERCKMGSIMAVKEAVKKAMWVCSSGVNNRPLHLMFVPALHEVDASHGSLREEDLQHEVVGEQERAVWAAVSPDMQSWAQEFVHARLAVPNQSV